MSDILAFSLVEDSGPRDNLERCISSHGCIPLLFSDFPESFAHPLHIWVVLYIVHPDFPTENTQQKTQNIRTHQPVLPSRSCLFECRHMT